jgi:hypothetical protein
MASLYRRSRSPFWWIKYRDPMGQVVRESTGLRHGQLLDTREARKLEAKRTVEERESSGGAGEHWLAWVPAYIVARHAETTYSGEIWRSRWANLFAFLCEEQILVPRQVRRSHANLYLAWRAKPHPGMRVARHNTALTELHMLSHLLNEAVNQGFMARNPLQRLGIPVQPRKEKPEMSDEQLELVSSLIEQDREHHHYLHLRRSFDIARWQGCRVAETQLNPQTDVALSRDPNGVIVSGTIRFRIKGNRHHTTTLHPQLFGLFDRLQREGATSTYPPYRDKRGHPRISFHWIMFQRRHQLKKLIPGWTFHCLRVTVITRMARANVPEAKAMRFIGHATATVHRIYQRLQVHDLDDAINAISNGGRPGHHPSATSDCSAGNPESPKQRPSSA